MLDLLNLYYPNTTIDASSKQLEGLRSPQAYLSMKKTFPSMKGLNGEERLSPGAFASDGFYNAITETINHPPNEYIDKYTKEGDTLTRRVDHYERLEVHPDATHVDIGPFADSNSRMFSAELILPKKNTNMEIYGKQYGPFAIFVDKGEKRKEGGKRETRWAAHCSPRSGDVEARQLIFSQQDEQTKPEVYEKVGDDSLRNFASEHREISPLISTPEDMMLYADARRRQPFASDSTIATMVRSKQPSDQDSFETQLLVVRQRQKPSFLMFA